MVIAIVFFATFFCFTGLASLSASTAPFRSIVFSGMLFIVSVLLVWYQSRRENSRTDPVPMVLIGPSRPSRFWLIYLCLLVPLILAFVTSMATNRFITHLLLLWYPTESKDPFQWCRFAIFFTVLPSLAIAFNYLAVTLIRRISPSFTEDTSHLVLWSYLGKGMKGGTNRPVDRSGGSAAS